MFQRRFDVSLSFISKKESVKLGKGNLKMMILGFKVY
ncbi:hypothetical protein WwAna0539 [Wolbachia endosymbiont of Drosophila ananassae]|nr:hypothetical protein WwAna0539 [Wolbachia endosymbiont of Drosophila ananassae]